MMEVAPVPHAVEAPSLPPLPEDLLRLRHLQARTDCQEAIVAHLEDCPALGGRLLRLANLAHPGLPGRLATLRIATAYLGCDGIGRIAQGLIVIDAAAAGPALAEKYLERAFHTALLATQLARIFEPSLDPCDLWPMVLLYDIGVLVRGRSDPAIERKLAAYCRQHCCSELAAETAFGWRPHTLLGAELCTRWGLSAETRLACLHHEDARVGPGSLQQRDRRRMVMLADRATRFGRRKLCKDLQRKLRREMGALADVSDERWFALIMGRSRDLQHVVSRSFVRGSVATNASALG